MARLAGPTRLRPSGKEPALKRPAIATIFGLQAIPQIGGGMVRLLDQSAISTCWTLTALPSQWLSHSLEVAVRLTWCSVQSVPAFRSCVPPLTPRPRYGKLRTSSCISPPRVRLSKKGAGQSFRDRRGIRSPAAIRAKPPSPPPRTN